MPREKLERIKKATVAIIAMVPHDEGKRPFTIVGSGFCVDPAGVVVTCEHVFRAFVNPEDYLAALSKMEKESAPTLHELRASQPFALFYNGLQGEEVYFTMVPITGAAHKMGFDLMACKLGQHGAFQQGFPTLEIADYSELYEGQEIGTCGYPLGEKLHDQMGSVTSSFTKGTISSISPAPGVQISELKMFQLDLTATHGNSGGPVYDLETGKVFGVLQGGVWHSPGVLLPGIAKAEPVYPLITSDTIGRIKNHKMPA